MRRLVAQLVEAAPSEAMVLVCGLVSSAVMNSRVWVEFSRVHGASQTALGKKDASGFWRSRRNLLVVLLKLAFWSVAEDLCGGWLGLRWREIVTKRLLEKYLPGTDASQATARARFPFYRIKLDPAAAPNPDQRIAEDVAEGVKDTVTLARELIGNGVKFVAFSRVLMRISPRAFYGLLMYALFGTAVTVCGFSRGLISSQDEVRSREAHLRFALVRVDECAESVAFYGAAAVERTRLWAACLAVLRARWRVLLWSMSQQAFERPYSWVTMILPSIMMAPAYFRGEVELGAISQLFMAFTSVKLVLLFIATNYGTLSSLQAKFERLEHLHRSLGRATCSDDKPLLVHARLAEGMEKPCEVHATATDVQEQIQLEEAPAHGVGSPLLELHDLRIALPSTTLAGSAGRRWLGTVGGRPEGSSLQVNPGEAVLLQGPSGVGKSAMLRAIAGLWDEGTGWISRSTNVFFLPQASYLPAGTQGAASTLREQLLFPWGTSAQLDDSTGTCWTRAATPDLDASELSDVHLTRALEVTRLGWLLQDPAGIDAEADWATRLSGGERQRLAFARLLLQLQLAGGAAGEGCVVLLDEATSACDEDTECALYKELTDRLRRGGLLSVGHRGSLRALHTRLVELSPPNSAP